ncbi:hypothetical protein Tco_1255098 [Tanacetum coccineum]
MMVMILVSVRCRSKNLYIIRSFRSLWQKPTLQNTIEDRIIDSGASFHATYCKEEIERFKLCSDKVRLVDDKTLDIAGVGYFDEEGYHVSYGDQQWKVTKGSVVVACENKRGSLYMVEIGMKMPASKGNVPDIQKVDIYFCTHSGEDKESAEVGASLYRRLWPYIYCINMRKDLATMILLSKTAVEVAVCIMQTFRIVMLKMVPETPLHFGVAKRLSQTFRAESMRHRAEAPKMLWADSVSTTYLIYRIPYVPIGLRILEEEWRGKDTSLAHLKAAALMKCDTSFGIRRVTRLSVAEILHLWTRFMEPDTSEGSKNSGSFEDSGRSDEEFSKDGASSNEGGSETPHVRRSTRESRAPVRYSPSANYLLLTENDEPDSYSDALNYYQERMHHKACGCSCLKNNRIAAKDDYNQLAGQEGNLECRLKEIMYGLIQAPRLRYLKFDNFMQKDKALTWQNSTSLSDSWNEEHCRDVHQVGDEREVEVMRSFNWPPGELIMEDGVLLERACSVCSAVQKCYSSSIVEGKVVRSLQRLLETESSEVITPFR